MPASRAYRTILRAASKAFQGDAPTLASARQELRSRFESAAGVRDPKEVARLEAEAVEAADFLGKYVVQAELNERGNYAMQVQPHHGGTVAEEAALRPPRQRPPGEEVP